MAAGQLSERWNHTATLQAAIFNTMRSRTSDKVWTVADLHPDRQREDVPEPVGPMTPEELEQARARQRYLAYAQIFGGDRLKAEGG